MKNSLLSIVVPTKNRTKYLKSFIELICSFQNDDIELVIQDNSDSNAEILEFLSAPQYSGVVYHYDPTPMPVIQNSELAICHSSGKYVCFMGDDDLLSGRLYDFVKYMDQYGYESAVFQRANYSWPGVTYKSHKFPNLRIPQFRGALEEVNVAEAYGKMLAMGAVSLEKLPQLYHGVVLRERLDEVFQRAGTYFPGPSPDMAISAALTQVVKKHLYCDVPYITSGASPKSAAGLGAKHMHKGNLKDMAFLPKDTEMVWESAIPKIWTGPTIYAESALKALRAMGAEEALQKFNYTYFYAHFYVFCREYQEMLDALKTKKNRFSAVKYWGYVAAIFLDRCRRFLLNRLISKYHINGTYRDGVETSVLAEKYIDEEIAGIDIGKMFTAIQGQA